MLNEYVWKLYLQSGGNKTVDFFKNSLTIQLSEKYADDLKKLQEVYSLTELSESTHYQLTALVTYYKENEKEPYIDTEYIEGTAPIEDVIEEAEVWIEDYYQYWLKEDEKDKNVFERFIESLPFISTNWAILCPGVFVPYYFFGTYNVLTTIANTFGIDLPEIPKKADYKARLWHYTELCKAFYRFRQDNNLSVYEFCAFLYDFAPQYIGGKDSYIIKDLPEPRSAFFVGGGGNNEDATAEDDPETVSFWQSNPATRAGDLIVMYLRTPISAISSIWRSKSVGFIDPFFYYYRCTYIGDPIKVNRIPLDKIKEDPVLGAMPIVRKNMLGINGVEFRPSEYNHIVDLTKADVPRLEYIANSGDGVYENEKAVEEKLIKPLIDRLGYSEEEYVQQMYVEIGNHNHALIPDFVLHPESSKGHYSGEVIIEAKRSITSNKQLTEVKSQARSYAKLLGTKYAVIAAQEKVWVMSEKDDYTECIFEESWDSLENADVFYELNHLIGKR